MTITHGRLAILLATIAFIAAPLFAAAEVSVQSLLTTFQACIADAQTETDIELKKAAYAECIAEAREQISEILASRSTPPAPPSPDACVNAGQNLYLGDTDATTDGAVTKLQDYLIAKQLLNAAANGVYDEATKQAVGQLQISLGIVNSAEDTAYGYFGPRTRAAVACTGRGALVATPAGGPAPLTVHFTTSISAGTIDFGDGSNGPVLIPICAEGSACSAGGTHTYTAPGKYVAKLTNSSGIQIGAAMVVVTTGGGVPPILPSPSCALSASPSSVAPGGAVNFSWTSTNAVSVSFVVANNEFNFSGQNTIGLSPTGSIVATAPQMGGSKTVTVDTLGQNGTVVQCSANVSVSVTPPPPPPAISLINIFRFYKSSTGEHFFTTNHTEGVNAGFSDEGVGFTVSGIQNAGMIPLYRCLAKAGIPSAGKHYTSTRADCETNGTNEGIYGYIYSASQSATKPIYRFYLPSNGDHLTTANESEGVNAGYVNEGIHGYVPVSSTASSGDQLSQIASVATTLKTILQQLAQMGSQ